MEPRRLAEQRHASLVRSAIDCRQDPNPTRRQKVNTFKCALHPSNISCYMLRCHVHGKTPPRHINDGRRMMLPFYRTYLKSRFCRSVKSMNTYAGSGQRPSTPFTTKHTYLVHLDLHPRPIFAFLFDKEFLLFFDRFSIPSCVFPRQHPPYHQQQKRASEITDPDDNPRNSVSALTSPRFKRLIIARFGNDRTLACTAPAT